MRRTTTVAASLALGLAGLPMACGDGGGLDLGGSGNALVRGRVTARDGTELELVEVRVGEERVRTDAQGLFELRVPANEDLVVRVDSPELAGGEAVLRLGRGEEASVDLSVMRMRRITIVDAERGGRFEGEDGFAIELPERALRKPDGEVVTGQAELRYSLVDRPSLIRVAPELRTRDEEGEDQRLRSEGMLEARFYQQRQRLDFEGEARTEVPLPSGSELRDGDEIDVYHYDPDSGRWEREMLAEIEERKWVAQLDQFSWWTAAEPLDVMACVRAELRTTDDEPAGGTVVTAEGQSLLWLSTAEADDDGEVCVEAPPDSDLMLSAFLSTGFAQSEWSALAATPDGAGTCGGEGCADLGVQRFKPVVREGGGDGGVAAADAGAGTGVGTGATGVSTEGDDEPDTDPSDGTTGEEGAGGGITAPPGATPDAGGLFDAALPGGGLDAALPVDAAVRGVDASTFDAGTAGAFDAGTAGAFDAGTAGAFDAGTAGAFDAGTAGAFDAGTAGAFDASIAQ